MPKLNLNLSNWTGMNLNMSEFIAKIFKDVTNKINRDHLHFLDVQSHDEVFMVGIYGIGGIGKTNNSIADQFEGLCFIDNMSENSSEHGLQILQEKLLSKIIGLNM
jgi:hypothetical protein